MIVNLILIFFLYICIYFMFSYIAQCHKNMRSSLGRKKIKAPRDRGRVSRSHRMRPWLPADLLQPFFAFSGHESPPFYPGKPSLADTTRRAPNKQAFPWLRAITGVDQRLTTCLWVSTLRTDVSKSVRGFEIKRGVWGARQKKKRKIRKRRMTTRANMQ